MKFGINFNYETKYIKACKSNQRKRLANNKY